MSQENVEVVWTMNDAFRRGDWDAMAAILDPDVLVRPDARWPEQRLYGHEAVMAFYTGCVESLGPEARIEDIVDLGDRCSSVPAGRFEDSKATPGRDALLRTQHLPRGTPDLLGVFPRARRSPQSRRARGVGDVAGERGDRAPGIDAFIRQDGEATRNLWATDGEWRPLYFGGGLLEGTVYRGVDRVVEFVERQAETWESVGLEVLEIQDVDDYVIVKFRLSAIGRASGIPVERVTWNVCTLRDRKIAVGQSYLTENEALKAVGLEE